MSATPSPAAPSFVAPSFGAPSFGSPIAASTFATPSSATPRHGAPSRLVLTRYIDRSVVEVEAGLSAAVSVGLDQAQVAASTEPVDRGVRLVGDGSELTGSVVSVGGIDGLAELTVAVPWTDEDSSGSKLLVAGRFAETVAQSARSGGNAASTAA